jgi:hypothetical protein
MVMKVPANRAVAVLTPAVFAPLAGAISVFAAKQAKMNIDPEQLTAIFIAGATIAFGKSALWLKGWQDFEKGQQMPADALLAADDVEALSEDETVDGDETADDLMIADADADADADIDAEAEGDFDEPSIEDDEEPEFHEEPATGESHLVLNGVNG